MKQTNSVSITLGVAAAVLCFALSGCGGSGGSPVGANPTVLNTTPAPPQAGNYQTAIKTSGSRSPQGSLLLTADSSGDLTISAGAPGAPGIYTGTTTVGTNNTFSAVLTNTSNGSTTTASGTAATNSILVSLSGSISCPSVTANFDGITNPLAGTYAGSIYGGVYDPYRSITFIVSSNAPTNVGGSVANPVKGTLFVTGSLTPVGLFTATIPYGLPGAGGVYNLTGTFSVGSAGQNQISGTWVDSLSSGNTGPWSAVLTNSVTSATSK